MLSHGIWRLCRNSFDYLMFIGPCIIVIVEEPVLQTKARSSACNTDTTPTQPHRIFNKHRTKNKTTNVVIQ